MSTSICARVNKKLSDSRPLTCYLYSLSALFSLSWAVGTELWKQWAAACTNSLGSPGRLFNPFHRGLTLMSPARLPKTRHLSRCTQDQHTHTKPSAGRSLEGMLNDAALVHPSSPLTPCPLSSLWSFLPPSLLPFSFSHFADSRGGIAGNEHERQEREHPGERYATFKHTHSLSLCHAITHTCINTTTHFITGNGACLADRMNTIHSCKHAWNHTPSCPRKTQWISKHTRT